MAAVAAVAAATPAAAAGQALRVEVRSAETGEPVAGALLGVADEGGRFVATATTPASGHRFVALPAAGRYWVHVRRVGFEPHVAPAVTVGARDTVAVVVRAPARPVRLAAVRTTGRPVCGRGGTRAADERVVALWEQLRTALTLTELARAEGGAPTAEVRRWVSRLSPDRRTVLRHTVLPPRPAQARPFATFTPAEFSARGYVRHEADGPLFAAPDERVLLAESFATEHCLRWEGGGAERSGLVGVAFAPAPGRRVPEIAGVLWADSATAALRWLEFWYVDDRLPADARGAGRAGGEVHFAPGADGRWAVRAWRLRMPLVRTRERDERTSVGTMTRRRDLVLVGFVETGALAGDAADASSPAARRLADWAEGLRPAVVHLVAHDSLLGRPLAGARLHLRQLPDSAARLFEGAGGAAAAADAGGAALADSFVVADVAGRATVAGLPPGRYELRAGHDDLDAVGVVPPPREILLVPGAAASDTVATPSFATLWASCGRVPVLRLADRSGTLGIVYGLVRDEEGRPAGGVEVSVWWAGEAPHPERTAAARTNDRGEFAICAVPAERGLLRLRAEAGRRRSPVVEVALDHRHRVAARELRLGAASAER